MLLAISLCILLFIFEILMGFVLDNNKEDTRFIRLRENPPLIDIERKPSKAHLDYSENLANKSYRFRTDANGFLYPSFPHGNYADKTIAFIGGSTTECMFVDEESRFPYLVGKQLSTEQHKVNAINAGVSGNDSLHSINAYLNKVIPFKPDIAVLLNNINDLSVLLHEDTYWNNNPYRSPIGYEDKSLNALIKIALPNTYEFLFRFKTNIKGNIDEFANDRGKPKHINADRIYALFEDNLEMFIGVSKAKGITPVLMTQANRFTDNPDKIIKDKIQDLDNIGINYNSYKSLYDGMNQRIRDVAATHKVKLIDLAAQVPQSNTYMVDSVHFNNQGSAFVANIIAKELENTLKTD